jgi:orotidine-5'-phosphate decarboxylase
VGLDPQIDLFIDLNLEKFYFEVLDLCKDLVTGIKINSAYFESYGIPGIQAFSAIIKRARSLGLIVLGDIKRSDISSTAKAYARAYLSTGDFEVDAITVTPYLGFESLKPFFDLALLNGKGVFMLLHSSNEGRRDLQDLILQEGESVVDHLAKGLRIVLDERPELLECVGVVVGATSPKAHSLRHILPQSTFLMPGLGSQGGSEEWVRLCADKEGFGVLVPVSRALFDNHPHTSFSEWGESFVRRIGAIQERLWQVGHGISLK